LLAEARKKGKFSVEYLELLKHRLDTESKKMELDIKVAEDHTLKTQ